MVRELADICKIYGIPSITGELSPADAKDVSARERRDGFWQSLGAKISYNPDKPQTGEIEIDIRKPFIKDAVTYEIRETDFEIQMELNKLKTEKQELLQHIHGLKDTLEFERSKPLWLRFVELIMILLSRLINILFYPFSRLRYRRRRSGNAPQ